MEKISSNVYNKPRLLPFVKARSKTSRKYIEEALEHAGITVNGNEPHDIIVHNNELFDRVIREGSIGVGESYMDGWWECRALDEFFNRIFRADLKKYFDGNWSFYMHALKSRLLNLQKGNRSWEVGVRHYDAGNAFYRDMLDDRMTYTCGYWAEANTLDEAQEAKLDLICQKLALEPGMRVLDIGCGWGSFAGYAAEKYGVEVTGLTISQEQAELARKRCSGLPVDILLQDYREVTGKFDRVLSVGMLEHVGHKNYRTYMETTERCLEDDGIAFVQTIGGNRSVTSTDPWISKYIFPNSMLPSISQIGRSMEGLFVMEDWHNFGPDYDKTLLAWHDNVEKSREKHEKEYDERFYRMWKFYLLSCAGTFRSRYINLWQITMTKQGRNQPECRVS